MTFEVLMDIGFIFTVLEHTCYSLLIFKMLIDMLKIFPFCGEFMATNMACERGHSFGDCLLGRVIS